MLHKYMSNLIRIHVIIFVTTLAYSAIVTGSSKKSSFAATEEQTLSINFENASLRSILEDLAKRKQANYEPIDALNDVKVTWVGKTPLSLEEAWEDLNSVFNITGFNLVEINGLIRIEQKSGTQSPPHTYIDIDPSLLPNSDQPIRYLRFFTNINNDKVTKIISGLLGESGTVDSLPDVNACLLSGPAINIKAAAELINELDTGGLRESIQVIQLKHTEASEIQRIFENILGIADQKKNPMRLLMTPKKEVAYFSAATRIIADTRTNKIILLGTCDNLEKIRHFIYHHLDKPLSAPKSRLHIKELKYADAEAIKDSLEDLLYTESSGGTTFFEDVKVVAEPSRSSGKGAIQSPAGNRLLVACNETDWKRIEKFIDKLDKPTVTVAMEVMFVEASVDSQRQLAAQFRNKKDGTFGRHINMQAQNLAAEPVTGSGSMPPNSPNLRTDMLQPLITTQAVLGSNFTIGCVDNIWTAVKVVFSETRFNVISQPFLIGNNNTKSTINLTDNHLVAGNINTDNVLASIPLVPYAATVEVELTPKVNLEGNISLESFIKIDQFEGTVGIPANNNQPPINKRHINTLASLHNGEVLVIGGLLQRSTEDDETKTPILGDIPILGTIFSGRNRTNSIKNLYVFIRPTIIKPQFEGRPDTYSQLKLDYANINLTSAVDLSPNDPIQRWFFGDKKGAPTLEQDQVSRFVSGRNQPQEVSIIEDPYYKASSSHIIQARKVATKERRKQLELRRRRIKREQRISNMNAKKASQRS